MGQKRNNKRAEVARGQEKEVILDALGDKYPAGLTIKQIMSAIEKERGSHGSDTHTRGLLLELEDDKKAHTMNVTGKNNALLYCLGPEPKPVQTSEQPCQDELPLSNNPEQLLIDIIDRQRRVERKCDLLLTKLKGIGLASDGAHNATIRLLTIVGAIAKELDIEI